MAGYDGYSMSNNAVQAYEDGEKPLSRWSKADILEGVMALTLVDCRKLTLARLRKEFLYRSSWHHTSAHYNKTDFYALDEEAIARVTIKDVESWYLVDRVVQKERGITEQPMYITALVDYDHWTGSRQHPKKEVITEVVHYMSTDKIVSCRLGNKRLSSLFIFCKIEQKTKYASADRVRRKYAKEVEQTRKERKANYKTYMKGQK